MRAPGLTHTIGVGVLVAASLGGHVANAHGDSGHGGGHGGGHHHQERAARIVRQATRDLRDVTAANDAGYEQFLGCVDEPGEGAMGTHYVNGTLVGDDSVDRRSPEALMFETRRDGSLRLVGVEYIVFQDVWDAGNPERPKLFGEDFHLVTSPNRYDLPPFYALHVWAWKHNPSGTFADWNPLVTCRHAAVDP
jgi:hypothetical protein